MMQESRLEVKKGAFIDFNIYPNPTSGLVNIVTNADFDTEEQLVRIFDTSGRIVSEFSLQSNNKQSLQIDLSDLSDGIYLIKYQNANESFVKKVIVRR